MKARIAVMIPRKPGMHPELIRRSERALQAMLVANPQHELTVTIDERRIPPEPGDCRPWSRVTRARNAMLDDIDLNRFDFLLWIDADVVAYPPDMPTKLIKGNGCGVSAPMILIEGSERFYDWAAFIMAGKDKIEPENRWNVLGRNLQHDAPYWPTEPRDRIVSMDCVGTITMVPTWIYRDGIRYVDHPAFTDHYPICKHCRDCIHMVNVNRDVVAYHANLPDFGEEWH